MTMLDRMRRHKSWLKWSLGLVVLAFVVFYIPDFLQQDTADALARRPREVIAEVDGRPLTAGEFQQRYLAQMQAYRHAVRRQRSTISCCGSSASTSRSCTQMIDEQVAVVEAERQGIRVSDDELAQQIFAIPGLQENGRFIGEARYEQLLRSQTPPLTKRAVRGAPAAQHGDRQAARRRSPTGWRCRTRSSSASTASATRR